MALTRHAHRQRPRRQTPSAWQQTSDRQRARHRRRGRPTSRASDVAGVVLESGTFRLLMWPHWRRACATVNCENCFAYRIMIFKYVRQCQLRFILDSVVTELFKDANKISVDVHTYLV